MASIPTAGPSGINDDARDPQDYELWAEIESIEVEARAAALHDQTLLAIKMRKVNLSRLLRNAKLNALPETQQTRTSLANDCRVYGNKILSEKAPGYYKAARMWYYHAFQVHHQGRSFDHPAVMDARHEYALDLKSIPDVLSAIYLLQRNLLVRIQKCGMHDAQTQKARFELAKTHEQMAKKTLVDSDFSTGLKHADIALEHLQALLNESPEPVDQTEDYNHFYVRLHVAFILYLLNRQEEAREQFQTCLELIGSRSEWQEHQALIKNYIAACSSAGPSPDILLYTSHELIEPVHTSQNKYQDTPAGKAPREQGPEAYKGRTLSANATDDPTKWIEGLRKTHKLLGISNGRVHLKYEHVKVAILDTGIDGSLQHVNCSENIIEWKSWIPGDAEEATNLQGNRQLIEQVCIDEDGHGTHLAAVIMDVNPLAKLYVARIAGRWNDINPEHVAKAITHASQEWKVDIITMSLGFKGRPTKIVRAIENVQNVLMFAAGSNDGLLDRVPMYPASDSKVIRVNSADHRGAPSPDNALPTGFRDYTTLGVDVASLSTTRASLDHGRALETRSGCSVATAVMAGTASLFLEFLRQEAHTAGNDRDRAKMRVAEFWVKKNMIEHIFDAISTPNPSFRFIQPWALLDGGDGMAYTALDGREKARTTILNELDAQGCDFSEDLDMVDSIPSLP